MTLWIGKPGALVQMPSPRRGLDATPDRASTSARTIGGGRIVSFAPGVRRTLKPSWATLSYTQYAALEALYTGASGPGPWVVLDSARRNHLAANQAAATAATFDTTGFTADPSEPLTSNADGYLRGPRSLRWTLPAAVTSGLLELDPPAGLVGVPAPPGVPWTFSGSLTVSGSAPSVTITPALSWRRVDGSEVSATLGTPVAAAGAWSAFSVTAAGPPAGAVAVRAQLRVAQGVLATAAGGQDVTDLSVPPPYRPAAALTISPQPAGRVLVIDNPAVPRLSFAFVDRAPSTGTDVLLDQPQLDMSATARPWAPGTGVPQCSWISLTDVETWVDHRMPIDAVLVEVG
jgi:hypothetical protein